MTEVRFYDQVPDEMVKFAVILAKSEGKWILCQHRQRQTWEVPGGHREPGETVIEAACRELREETGAISFDLQPICFYSVLGDTRAGERTDTESFGMLYAAQVYSMGEFHSEIASIRLSETLPTNWTYPTIQPLLIAEADRRAK